MARKRKRDWWELAGKVLALLTQAAVLIGAAIGAAKSGGWL